MASSRIRYSFRSRPMLEVVEDRSVPALLAPIPDDSISVSPDDGGIPRVKIIDPVTGEDVAEIEAYEVAFRGGVRSALGDVNNDGVKDLVIAPGVGGGPRVKIIDGKTGNQLADFLVYEASFTGGLYVAVGDVDGDGFGDILTGTGNGGGPRVRVLSGATLGQTVLKDYFAYESTFRGGVLVAAGDVNGDGRDDIITGTGIGGGPRVITFSGLDDRVLNNFFAYEDSFRGGVLVSAGDVDGDGDDDIITGTGPGGGPVVRVLDGRDAHEVRHLLGDDLSFRGGVYVETEDINGDGRDDVITHTRHGNDVALFGFDSATGIQIRSFVRTVDDNPSADDIAEGGSGGEGSGGSGNQTIAARVEGTITAVNVSGGTVTIQPASGSAVVVKTGPATKVERNDLHVTLSAFLIGDFGEAKIATDGIAWQVEAIGP